MRGRGGAQHKYLQELVRQWAEKNGWRAGVEETIPGGSGRVDVALRNGERSIACEIGITTSPEHEFENIRKCFTAGFERVLLVAPDRSVRSQLKSRVATLPPEQAGAVDLCSPEEILALLDRLGAAMIPAVQTVGGYRVKVRHQVLRPEEEKKQRGAVASIIAKALRRGRGTK